MKRLHRRPEQAIDIEQAAARHQHRVAREMVGNATEGIDHRRIGERDRRPFAALFSGYAHDAHPSYSIAHSCVIARRRIELQTIVLSNRTPFYFDDLVIMRVVLNSSPR